MDTSLQDTSAQLMVTVSTARLRLTRFIREGAESGLWGDQITPNIMAWG
jgi:hypothetical protein